MSPPPKPGKQRLDTLVVDRGLSDTRSRAQALIIAGQVVVDDQRIDKAGTMVPVNAAIRLRGEANRYVSRGGLKLAGALRRFAADGLELAGRVAMDVGASTGGFTDCLLQLGVAKVHAVDVGYGQLAWKLATDDRVVAHDRRNIRKLDPGELGERVSLVVIDCSFISLVKVLPHLPPFLAPTADLVILVKPQFEVGKDNIGKGGIVRDDTLRVAALDAVREAALGLGFQARAHCDSDTHGRMGNREFLLWLTWAG
ncbi:MAG: TlyA family RNA methyltransferase [Nannocystaceae bacterium]|nr:TlyA family RNA methyltransferase [Nannocystaceae bacterium]